MLPLSQILMDLSTTILAILIGLLAYRKLPTFYRVLFFQALAYLIIDSYAVTYPNNGMVYNISILIEIGLLLLAAHVYFKTFVSKWISFIGYFAFLLVWCFDIYYHGKNQLAYHAYILGGIFITAMYIRILFDHYTKKNDNFRNAPLLLSCLGIFIFFAGIVPYLSMMYYLQGLDSVLNKRLFQYMMVYPAIIRYFLLALAFWLVWKNRPVSLNNITA